MSIPTYYSVLCCSILSILGSLFIIFVYLASINFQNTYTKIVFYIAISDLIRSICFLIPCNLISNEIIINTVAIISDSSILIAVIWSANISVTIYQAITDTNVDLEKNHKFWWIFSFVIVPSVNLLPIITSSHGKSDFLCTFSQDSKGKIWRITILYIPLWIFILVSIVSCVLIHFKLKHIDMDPEKQASVKKVFLYPVVLTFFTLPLTISMIFINFTNVNTDAFNIYGLIALCLYSLHGFFNAIIYGFTVGIKKIIRESYNISVMSLQPKVHTNIRTSSFDSPNLLFSTFSENYDENS